MSSRCRMYRWRRSRRSYALRPCRSRTSSTRTPYTRSCLVREHTDACIMRLAQTYRGVRVCCPLTGIVCVTLNHCEIADTRICHASRLFSQYVFFDDVCSLMGTLIQNDQGTGRYPTNRTRKTKSNGSVYSTRNYKYTSSDFAIVRETNVSQTQQIFLAHPRRGTPS